MSIQKPRLLRTGETLDPIALELTLATDDLPAARITIADDPGVELHDVLEIWTAQGSAGLFRVTDRSKTYAGEISLTCKGALDTLSDDVFPGTAAITGTVSAAITSILSKQSAARWRLGTCAMSGNVKIDNSYSNLYELMENIRQQHPGYWWTYDYSTTPWTVNLAALPNTLAAEFRLGRNVSSATIDLSDAEMCTKLYMTVTSGSTSTLYTYDDATAQSEWGVITKCIDVNADDLPGTPAEYAAEIFAERGQPLAFITLEGYDLKRLTGDDFDKITLGSNCRVVLEDFAGTFTERVTRIQWPNVLDTPDEIRVSLANNLKPFREQLNLIRKTAGGAARKSEENERELIIHQTAIDRNNERILLWATEEQWDEIAEQYQITHKSQLDITAQQIESTVVQTGITAGVNTFSPDATYAAGDKCIYNGVVYQFTAAHTGAWTGSDVTVVPSMQSQITQNATAITLKVSQGDVATQLAIECGNVTITGGDLILEGALIANNGVVSYNGTIIADTFEGRYAEIDTINALQVTASNGFNGADSYTMASYDGDLVDSIKDVQIIAASGNNYKLQYKTFKGNAWTDAGTFSRAIASWTYGWSNGSLTVTAQPQNQSDSTRTITQGSTTWDYTNNTATIPVVAVYGSQGQYSEQTGLEIYVNASQIWQNGYDAGGGGVIVTPALSVSWTPGTESTHLTVSSTPAPQSDVNLWFAKGVVSWSGNTATLPITTATSQGGSTTAQFSVTVDASGRYNAGWNNAYGDIAWPSAGTGTTFTVTAPNSTVDGAAVTHTFTIAKGTPSASGGYASVSLSGTVVGRISLDNWWDGGYDAGWGAAYGDIVWPSAGTGTTFTVTAPSSTVDGTAVGHTFTIAKGTPASTGGYASVSLSGTVVGRIALDDWWDDGWDAGNWATVTAGAAQKNGANWWDSQGVWNCKSTLTMTRGDGSTDTKVVTVNIQDAINVAANEGWKHANSVVSWPAAGTATSFSVSAPALTEWVTDTKTFTLSQSGSTVYVNDGTNNVAKISVSGSYPNSVTLTRYRAGATESIIPGKLYRYNSNGTYTALGTSSTYWYGCTTNLGSSRTVHY